MGISAASLAILCLFASGILDFVFKLYSMRPRSRGLLICGVGGVWFVLQSVYIASTSATVVFTPPTIVFGLLAAVFVTLSNILLLESFGHLPISMASTIYRLNTIPLVILAFIFLGEHVTTSKSAGILAGLISVLLLYQRHNESSRRSTHFFLFLGLIILASCIRALYGFTTKLGIEHGGDVNTMLLIGAVGWVVGGYSYLRYREDQIEINRTSLTYMATAGALVFAVVWLLTMALKHGEASVVIPLANMGFVAAFVLSVALKMESLTIRKGLAIVMAMAAIILLTRA